ncbi:hypothetical protein QUA05_09780 [Microcoleus sp. SVA1_A1]|uniref:hypothetical protein n=1 Tax=Microcoleus sp. SVA1_A4 TaxID=2818948 RepID=UPI002FD600BE
MAPFHLRMAISIDSLFDRHLIRSASGAYGILARRGDRTRIVSPGAVWPSPTHQC